MIFPTPSVASSDPDGASGGGDGIEILVFARAKRAASTSLKKESKSAYDPSDPKSGGVIF
jgi:hypothetical protein